MIICGLKLTHDGSIAVIDNNKLMFSIEIEKLANNLRYSSIEDTACIESILRENGYSCDDIDQFAIDGWGGYNQDALAIQPRLEIGEAHNRLSATDNGHPYTLDIGQYHERALKDSILEESSFTGLRVNGRSFNYTSYLHVTNHVLSAYCSSPFAARNEGSYILVWDGGMYPRLYYLDGLSHTVENLGPIFLLIGNIYSIFSQHFKPFLVNENTAFAKDSLSVAGKVMAYIALGKVRPALFEIFEKIYHEEYNNPMGFANAFALSFKNRIKGMGIADEDVLATFHVYLENLLIEKLRKKIGRYTGKTRNLCLVGGCALNIKWNSAIRNETIFKEVYVPPFPNDSGSAIGAACTYLFRRSPDFVLDWNVYSGPKIKASTADDGWNARQCSLKELAALLHSSNEPVVFLNGRAELGPRALGNRSILASPVSPYMKTILNDVKKREHYRPVSPICLEEEAKAIFLPGISDPYMLFDHQVKEEWLDRLPAVCHLDNSARLQTVNETQNPIIAELLGEYHALSQIPLLCNTSANFNGSGFFPDVNSATRWGQVNYVWSDGVIYEKQDRVSFESFKH